MLTILNYYHLNIIPQSMVTKRWCCMGVDCTYRICGVLYSSQVWLRNVYSTLLLVGRIKKKSHKRCSSRICGSVVRL